MSYIVSATLCPQNHRCPILRVCPSDAIVQDGFGLPVIDKSKCTECGKCASLCPTGAVSKKN
jgi:Fe-S-cluster-containing hydrogenase component 2